MPKEITAWFSIGSTYTYLTALRIRKLINQHDIVLVVKPISIRQIMKNMNNIPFPPEKKSKLVYMWRDIERRANLYGIPKPNVPAPYPLKAFDVANTVGVALNSQGLYLDYFEATYKSWFLDGHESGSEENLRFCAKELNISYDELLSTSFSKTVSEEYKTNTLEAEKLGIFGAPSFTVGSELFWGDDRLEDAINFAK
ncbi:MAG: 2-hydroxychromene-2-carboxylate isomerase [Rhodospirillaceae bacterium]|nr:2-hydroxychromene-2-carboxylate isomerase [Rhodospirillaceae bacterium]|tara:strand:- start:22214 stop:22807 length:594 start_codon:yes stop_codon:yes gene_type:complete